MKNIFRSIIALVGLPTFALAVYAPIPEQEQGKALTVTLGSSIYNDSNIFGGATGEIESVVYGFSGQLSYNGSIDDQTFASASYGLKNDHVVDRPGKKNLTSHSIAGRLAHSFAEDTNIDVSGAYDISKNPESLLAGIPLNTDQSSKRAQVDARYVTSADQKTGMTFKYRFINYSYDTASLAAALDRSENLFGIEANYAFLPETKLVAEFRYQSIGYDTAPNIKDKTSNFLMGGFDYKAGSNLLMSGRAGLEDRRRNSAPDTTTPYLEFSSRYSYNEGSYLALGYAYTLEETSDVARFTDSKVNRFFINAQHRLSGVITASGTITYEPAKLQGRGSQADIDEKTTRFGLGLIWQPTKNWSITGTYDLDEVNSDDANRDQNRDRLGVSARFTF